MLKFIKAFANDESGATAIEYGLIAALVALAGITAFTALGQGVDDAFQGVGDALCDALVSGEKATATGCA